jgi:type I restriction enzyme S subunit
MAGEWSEKSVAELQSAGALLVEDGNHGENRPRPDEFSTEGIQFIRAADMDGGRVLFESAQRINEIARQRVRKGIGAGGDVLLSHKGTVGKVAYVPSDAPPFICSPQTTFWRVKDPNQLDRRYIYFFLLSRGFREQLDSRKGETDMADYVSLTTQRTFKVALPPLADQKAMVRVLGTLDDKIELNRRMNATLEAVARALFQSWFVDFEPVRAKCDGRRPSGLDPSTAKLFPSDFHDSPIGRVPKGWKVERFDAHISAVRGLSYKGEGLRDDGTGLPMHNLNSVYEGGGYKHEGIKYYAGEYREKHLLKPGDMIVTNTEQGFDHLLIGHAAIVPRCYGLKGLFSHHIYRVRHKPTSPFSPHYLVELFNNRRWHYWISGFSNGTTINMLPMDALEMPMLVVPPVELVKKFTTLAEATHLQVEANKEQSRTLANLRDTLLPKLLSGELSVNLEN